MSNDATRETEQKNLDLLGNHWQVARCKSVCAAGEGIRRRWRGGRDRKLSTRVARFVLRPQNKAAKSGVFSLEAERRGDERNKKKTIETQESPQTQRQRELSDENRDGQQILFFFKSNEFSSYSASVV